MEENKTNSPTINGGPPDEAKLSPRRWWVAALWAMISPQTAYLYVGHPHWAAAGYIGAFVTLLYFLLGGFHARLYGVLIIACLILLYSTIPVLIALSGRRDYRRRAYNSARWYIATLFASLFILAFYKVTQDRVLGLHLYRIPTKSMENTLSPGDLVLADLRAYDSADPVRDDLVVYRYPKQTATRYLKRVAGVPGDTVYIKYKLLYVNNRMVNPPRTATYEDAQRIFPAELSPRDNFGPLVLSPGMFFVLGDNRDGSYDSRFTGPVPRQVIDGKAVLVLLSQRGFVARLDSDSRNPERRRP